MAVKKKIIIISERGHFACQAYIESATALSDYYYYYIIIIIINEHGCFVCQAYTESAIPYRISRDIARNNALIRCQNRRVVTSSHVKSR